MKGLTPIQRVMERCRKAAEYAEDGANEAQIARAMGVTVNTVRDWLREAARLGYWRPDAQNNSNLAVPE